MYPETEESFYTRGEPIDILDEWNGYKAGESLSVNGVLYEIVRIEKHDESGWAGAVLHRGYEKKLYAIDIPWSRESGEDDDHKQKDI